MRNGTLLSEKHIITIMYNTLCALKFLHDANILHRDIKPANLLVNLDCSIKIADFGLARLDPNPCTEPSSSTASTCPSLTNDGRQSMQRLPQHASASKAKADRKKRCLSPYIQTRHYRAPEILLRTRNYGKGVDTWSTGCILAELLACSEPYVKEIATNLDDPQQVMKLHELVNRRVLFNGKSSFMLSPLEERDENGQHMIDHRDQLVKQAAFCAGQDKFADFVDREMSMEYLSLCSAQASTNPIDAKTALS